ncbi:MAG: isochorismatase family protein [Zoogloeaceae bacterium]|jgi:nicotinamidase-related amidase|nr:isochorismatase family protein [Zoogloeaceae bacterium]
MARKSIHLLLIDPQNDFCDLPDAECGGHHPALPVPGAHADMLRLAALIERAGNAIGGITVTLDTHRRHDIAHPGFWRQADGSPVAPFTPIRAAEVKSGAFQPRNAELLPRVVAYLEALEAAGRYTHMVWPVHCEPGSWGHNLHEAVRRACARWEDMTGIDAEKFLKGRSPLTEHYSAIRAEVPDPASPDTLVNDALLDRLASADEKILVAGEAGSHCVKATVEDILFYRPETATRIVLLADCMSPVAGFAAQQAAFIETLRARGARVAAAAEILPELRENAA